MRGSFLRRLTSRLLSRLVDGGTRSHCCFLRRTSRRAGVAAWTVGACPSASISLSTASSPRLNSTSSFIRLAAGGGHEFTGWSRIASCAHGCGRTRERRPRWLRRGTHCSPSTRPSTRPSLPAAAKTRASASSRRAAPRCACAFKASRRNASSLPSHASDSSSSTRATASISWPERCVLLGRRIQLGDASHPANQCSAARATPAVQKPMESQCASARARPRAISPPCVCAV